MFAALYSLSVSQSRLVDVAQSCTPRFQVLGPAVLLDVGGLSRLFGGPREIGDELCRALGERRAAVRVSVAPTATAAMLMAMGRPGLTIASSAEHVRARLAPLPVRVVADLERLRLDDPGLVALDARAADAAVSRVGHPRDSHEANYTKRTRRPQRAGGRLDARSARTRHDAIAIQQCLDTLQLWGITTLGALAALPAADISERLGARGVSWCRLARGEDDAPLVPWVEEEPFEASLELEWPIEGLEPLSFVLARLLEPLSLRLERADRGAAVIHTHLHLVSRDVHRRALQLPLPMRDPKTLRTLVLLDLETHPPSAAIDRVSVLVEPTPGRVLQWSLFERAQPAPEQVSTLLARLTALMGEGHVGAPALVDSWKPGAFVMKPFELKGEGQRSKDEERSAKGEVRGATSVLRRFRLPVPARVTVRDGRPVRLQVDRRGLATGAIVQSAGPWRTSGHWWHSEPGATVPGGQGAKVPVPTVPVPMVPMPTVPTPTVPMHEVPEPHPGTSTQAPAPWHPGTSTQAPAPWHPGTSTQAPRHPGTLAPGSWDRDEWDVLVNDGVAYRIYVERAVGQWFIDGVID